MKEADRSTDRTVPGGYKFDLSKESLVPSHNDATGEFNAKSENSKTMESLEQGIHLMDLSSAMMENRSTWIDGVSLLSGRTLDHQGGVAEQPCRHCLQDQPINRLICQNCGNLLQSPSEDEPFVDVVLSDRFHVNAYLHSGIGYDTFHATDLLHEEPVLLRLYPLGSRSSQTMYQFQSWGEACKNAQHPALAPLIEVTVDPQWGGLWVEGITTGDSLFDFVERQKLLFLDHLLPLFQRLVEVLSSLHQQGVVHGHLHMGSLRLSEHPQQALTDWSLVGCASRSMLPLEQALERLDRSTPGSVLPFFPEMDQPINSLGPEVDVYRLGSLLFELVTSQPVFVGESLLSIYQQHRDQIAPSLLMARPDIPTPPGLQDLLAKSLAKHPQQRHRSVEEWLNELTNVVESSSNVLLPTEVFQPKATPMDQHLRDASNELLGRCHRPIFRKSIPSTWMLHHLSTALRHPNLRSLPSVESLMEDFPYRPSVHQTTSTESSEQLDSFPSHPSLPGYQQDASGDAFPASYQGPTAQHAYQRATLLSPVSSQAPSGHGYALQEPSHHGSALQAPSGYGLALQEASGRGHAFESTHALPQQEDFEFEWSWIHLVWALVVVLFLTAFALFLFR